MANHYTKVTRQVYQPDGKTYLTTTQARVVWLKPQSSLGENIDVVDISYLQPNNFYHVYQKYSFRTKSLEFYAVRNR